MFTDCVKRGFNCEKIITESASALVNLNNANKVIVTLNKTIAEKDQLLARLQVAYDEQPQTGDYSVIQRILRAHANVPISSVATPTAQMKWETLLQVIRDNPFNKDQFKRPNIWCAHLAFQFSAWVRTKIYGAVFGAVVGDIDPANKEAGGHVWNFAVIDNRLLFIDYCGTDPWYVVPHTAYFVMEGDKIKGKRTIGGWYL
jgi:hypothetical protein